MAIFQDDTLKQQHERKIIHCVNVHSIGCNANALVYNTFV